ncbi:MAG: AAA family ATPase [Candidatus Bathyarchaeia archaeon]|jgi:exonuclease SbcC
MILNQITLEDFISHKKTQIDLGYGINVIIGPNGAGKTSILDGISFALFNDYSSRGKKENLINSKAKKCKVKLGFTEAGIAYCIDWSLERKGAASGSFFRIVDGRKMILATGGERSVGPAIQNVLGIDKNMFLQSVYVRQGEIEQLVNARPADRKELISRLLGVEDLERAWNGTKEVIGVFRDKKLLLDEALIRKPKAEKEKAEAELESKRLEEMLTTKRNHKTEFESQLKSLQEVLSELEAKKKDFEQRINQKGLASQKIESFTEKLEKENEELGKAVTAELTVRNLESQVSKLSFLEAYVSNLSEREKLEAKIAALDEKLNEIKSQEQVLRENQRGHELFLEKDALLVEKNKSRKKFEGSNIALAKAKRQLEKCAKEKEKRETLLSREIEKYSKILAEPISVDNVDELLLRVKRSQQDKTKALDADLKKLTGIRIAVKQRIEDLEDNIAKFSSKSETKACPTCETELSKERISQLLGKYSEEKNAACTHLVTTDGVFSKSEAAIDKNNVLSRQIESLDADQLRRLASEFAEATEEASREQIEVDRLNVQNESLLEIDALIAKIDNEKKVFEQAFNEYNFAERQLNRLPSEAEIQVEKNPLAAALKNIKAELERFIQKLGYDPKSPQKELDQLRRTKQEYDQNLPIARRKQEYESNVNSTSTQLKEAQKALSEIIGLIEALNYDEVKHSQQRENFQKLENSLREIEKEIVRLEQEKNGFEKDSKKLETELKSLEAKASEKQRVDKYIAILNQIRDAYGKDGIQKMIRARARPVLEKATRDLFERFNLAYSDIKIDDDYNVSLIGLTGEQDIDQISGGERVALAIALRLAIAQVLSGKIETIIMDEPTTHLDEQRRKELVNILNSFFSEGGRIIPQMLIITHHPEIEDVADIIYIVRKEASYSIAERSETVQS